MTLLILRSTGGGDTGIPLTYYDGDPAEDRIECRNIAEWWSMRTSDQEFTDYFARMQHPSSILACLMLAGF